MQLHDPVSALSGVGEKRSRTLRAIGITTVGDLLTHYPRNYDDRSKVITVSELTPGIVNTIRGHIAREAENITFARSTRNSAGKAKPLVITKLALRDETGELELIWFNQPYLKKYFVRNQPYIFTGKVTLNFGRLQMESPDYEKYPAADGEALSGGRIVPLYTTVKNISQKTFRSIIHSALKACTDDWPDDLPSSVRAAYGLCGKQTAVQHIHFPDCPDLFLAARRRLVFEELFFMQSALFSLKGNAYNDPGIVMATVDYTPFFNLLPFAPTTAQHRVMEAVANDLRSGRRMNRLVQGDVGSGKTAVAMAVAFAVIQNGGQAAMMAPTEVLAEQHFKQCRKYFDSLGIHTVLLTGSRSKKERDVAQADIQTGRAGMVVGTHALIQPSVVYRNLSLVITDEQHRFGVNQRLQLSEKGQKPHVLVMTATPIPRTLGLILFGDMDISVIDELPPGRQTIKTYAVDSAYRPRLHAFIRKQTAAGAQVYIICPAIDETEEAEETEETHTPMTNSSAPNIQNVTQYTRELAAALDGITVACLHGRMRPAVKQAVMDDFAANQIQVLVATTVIEVGVDVPNATLMIIENADRFGLSQLHQLRGRVGRGKAQSYCVLVTDSKNEQTLSRMKAMTQTSDGFKLSEMDLQLRGTGDFFGMRQHGLPSFSIANLYRDTDILQDAQAAATALREGRTKIPPDEENRYRHRINAVFNLTHGEAGL